MRIWMKRNRRLLLLPATYLIIGGVLFLQQHSLIYYPDQTPQYECASLHTYILSKEQVIRGYYVAHPEATGIVVVYHGNAGAACHRQLFASIATQAGLSTLLVEYPGYAEEGRPTTYSLLEYTHQVREYLNNSTYSEIILLGESIGGGFASYHATHQAIDQLILINPFTSLSALAQEKLPIYPVRLLLQTDLRIDQWAKESSLIRILTAANDTVIPPSHSRRLVDSLPPQNTEQFIIHDYGHNDLYMSEQFHRTLQEYLRIPKE